MKCSAILAILLLPAAAFSMVQHVQNPHPVSIVAHAGMMTTDTESVVIRDSIYLLSGQQAICTANAQFVNEMDGVAVAVGRYLVVLEPDGEEMFLVRPHVENINGREQHYVAAQLMGLFEARLSGEHVFEYRAYCGTLNLRRDGKIFSVYNQMSTMVIE